MLIQLILRLNFLSSFCFPGQIYAISQGICQVRKDSSEFRVPSSEFRVPGSEFRLPGDPATHYSEPGTQNPELSTYTYAFSSSAPVPGSFFGFEKPAKRSFNIFSASGYFSLRLPTISLNFSFAPAFRSSKY